VERVEWGIFQLSGRSASIYGVASDPLKVERDRELCRLPAIARASLPVWLPRVTLKEGRP